MNRSLSLLCALALLPACRGGSEQASPQPIGGRLLLADTTIPAGSDRGLVELGLIAQSPTPVMIQFDLAGDARQMEFDEAIEALQGLGTLRTHRLESGHLRVVLGDLAPSEPATLPTGDLLRLPVRLLDGAGPGPFEIRIENIVASDAAGEAPPFDTEAVTARIDRE